MKGWFAISGCLLTITTDHIFPLVGAQGGSKLSKYLRNLDKKIW